MSIRRLLPLVAVFVPVTGFVLLSGATAAAPGENVASDPAFEEARRGEWSRWRGPKGDGISAETGLLKQWPLDHTLELANRMGAFVASQPGGTPRLPQSLLDFAANLSSSPRE